MLFLRQPEGYAVDAECAIHACSPS